MANPRPTPKPGNLSPPRPPGTSGNPAGYSRGRRISDDIERLLEEMAPEREFARRRGAWSADRNHWSRIATQHRSCLPAAVTSA